jgi:hypothetical protein
MSFPGAVAERNRCLYRGRLAPVKVGTAGIEQRLDPLIRREKFDPSKHS